MARLEFTLPLLDVQPPFPYQALVEKAARLKRLGLSAAAIARSLGVTDKTIAKAIRWKEGRG